MNRFLLVILVCLAFSCGDDEGALTRCIRAEYLTLDACSNFILLDVKWGLTIGKPLDYDGKHYNNVIKVVGNVPQGARYFRIRKFDSEKDWHLTGEPILCLTLYAPFSDIPEFVVEAESPDQCP